MTAGMELGYAQSVGSPDYTTSSTTPVDIPALATTVTIQARPIIVRFHVDLASTTAAFGLYIILNEDTTDIGIVAGIVAGVPIDVTKRLAPAAGTHTYKMRITNNSAGTATLHCNNGTGSNYSPMFIQVVEV